jgi:hypothetical protein
MKEMERIKAAAAGLVFISESDHPFAPVLLDVTSGNIASQLRQLSNKGGDAIVEEQTVDYFFRNHVKAADPGDDQLQTARKFMQLVKVLKEELADVKAYRVGTVQVDAYILGKLSDGRYAGLHTILIET